jgi:uncharacterized protein
MGGTMKVIYLIGFLMAAFISASCGQDKKSKDGYAYYCPPCRDGSCDTTAYDQPGACPVCQMPLIAKLIPQKIGSHGDTISFERFIGSWQGESRSNKQELKFSLEIAKDSADRVLFSSDEISAQKIPGDNIRLVNDSIQFDLTGDNEILSFKAGVKAGAMGGVIKKTSRITGAHQTQSAFFELNKTQKNLINYVVKEVSWKNQNAIISGSLYLPNGESVFPAIVFTHGAGPEQRYANAYMADYFAKRGIAVLIYDKRGAGRSTGNWQTSTYEDLADDCIEGIKFLKTQSTINAAMIGIYGHSQGGTISPLIVVRSKEIAFDIASAAFGVSPEEQDIYRVGNILRSDAGFTPRTIDSAMTFYKLWLAVAKTGTGWDRLEKEIPQVEKTQWYPWVAPPPKDHWIWKWYLSAGNYHPISYWETIKIPVLLLYGEKDLITPPLPSIKNIRAALRKAGNKNFKIVMFPNTTHEGNILGKPDEFWHKFVPGYCDTVYHWLESNVLNR